MTDRAIRVLNPFKRAQRLAAELRLTQDELTALKSSKAAAASQERILASIRAVGFDYSKLGQLTLYPTFPKSHADLLRRVFALSFNPMAHRILSIPVDLLHQHATPYQTENPDEERILSEFWHDPINSLCILLKQIIYEIGLYGEYFPTVFVNPISRQVRLGAINPFLVQSVIVDPDNDRIPIGVKLINPTDVADKDEQIVTTILSPRNLMFQQPVDAYQQPMMPRMVLDEDIERSLFSPRTQHLRSTFGIRHPVTKQKAPQFCFVFQEQPHFDYGTFRYMYEDQYLYGMSLRGTPDLIHVHDWILASDDLLSSMIERGDLLSRTLWTLQVDGGNLRQGDELNLDNLKARFGKVPERWEVRITNERMKYQRHDMPTGNSDMIELLRGVVRYIVSGCGYPETWFLGGVDANKASSTNMEFPTLKKLEGRQHTINHILTTLFDFVLAQHSVIPSYKIASTPLKDTTQETLAASLKTLGDSLAIAQTQGWLQSAEAGTIYRKLVQDLGVKLKDMPNAATITEQQQPTAPGVQTPGTSPAQP